MCGITGIIHTKGQAVEPAQLKSCTDALAHRGPDAGEIFIDGNVGLGHRRLSIIDLREAANQPFISPDGRYSLVFNGEIYNFKQLRTNLEAQGHTFITDGDSEVLLHAYMQDGAECLQQLRGMFAFAVYDKQQQTVFMARDRTGQKPLKYFYESGTFAFASEIKALQQLPMCPKAVDEQQLYDFLTMMYMQPPTTGWSKILTLPAGHSALLHVQTGEFTTQQYWSLDYTTDTAKGIDDWKESTMQILQEATALRTIADVPLGAFLSGGIDSAAIVGLLSQQSTTPVQTFSIGSDDERFNELPEARSIATKFNTNHTEIPLNANIVELLPELVRAYDSPFADPSSIPTYILCKQTRQHVTVALSGDGGDENFGGYSRYPIAKFAARWQKISCLLHPFVRGTTKALRTIHPTTFSYRAHRFQQNIFLPERQRYLQYLSFFTEAEKQKIWNKSMQRTDERYAQNLQPVTERGLHEKMHMDILGYLPEDLLPKVDIASMAHSLEVRSPFLDHTLLEHTATMPANLKLRGNVRKWILKEMLRGMLPPEILHQKKRGFRLPLDTWFRRDLQRFVQERLLDTQAPILQFCNRQGIEDFLQHYYRTNIDYSDHVWSLLWLNEWLSIHAYETA